MTAASGRTTVPGTVRGSTGTAMMMTTTMIGTNCAARAVVLRVSTGATVTVVTIVALAFNPRSATDRRDSAHGMRAGAVTMVIAGPAHSSAEVQVDSCTITTAARVVTEGDLKPRSEVDHRRLRRATDADRLVEARRPSRSAVVQTGGQASAAMEGAHSPGVVVLASAASASAEGTTDGALELDHSRTAAAFRPLGTDRDAAGTAGVTRATAGAIAPGMMTAADATSL